MSAAVVEPTYTRYVLHRANRPAGDETGDGSVPGGAADEAPFELRAALRDLRVTGWQDGEAGEIVFWLPAGEEDIPGKREALARLGAFGALSGSAQTPGWQDAWRAFHRPVTVGDLYIRPPWCAQRSGLLDIVIDVGMAFGTGAHETTRQCLEALTALPRGSLLDLGTGSGVLALAALRLGFDPVYALDHDDTALAAAQANARRNGLDPVFIRADLHAMHLELPVTDVVVANLDLPTILTLGARSPRAARLVLAGLLETQAHTARAAFPGYRLRERRVLGEWALLHLEPA